MVVYERQAVKPKKIIISRADTVTSPADNLWLNEEETAKRKRNQPSGKISLIERLSSGELTEEVVDRALRSIKKYLVRAYRGGRERCVDGRVIEGYNNKHSAVEERDLGPQIAGGTAGEAICDRLALGPDRITGTFIGTTFEQDVAQYTAQVTPLGFDLGGHTDNHTGPGKTGCGAVDRAPEIIQAVANPKYATRLHELTEAVLGNDAYDDKIYSEILGNALRLQAESETYFKEYRQTIFNKIKEQASSAIAKLVGKHNEVAVIINRVYGTTFNRDEFSADNDHLLQAFNYDFWHTVESVENIMRNSPRFKALSSDNRRFREAQKILTARVMYAVATLMTLTDGSLRLIVLDESEKEIEEGDQQREAKIINLFEKFGERKRYAPSQVLQV